MYSVERSAEMVATALLPLTTLLQWSTGVWKQPIRTMAPLSATLRHFVASHLYKRMQVQYLEMFNDNFLPNPHLHNVCGNVTILPMKYNNNNRKSAVR
jgi:hypothetical protein